MYDILTLYKILLVLYFYNDLSNVRDFNLIQNIYGLIF